MKNLDDRLRKIDETSAKAAIEREQLLRKAYASNDVESIYKAQQYLEGLNKKNNVKFDDKGKAMLIDPFNSSNQGYYEKRSKINFDILRAMAKTPIISAIIASRKEQVASYCVPQSDKYSKGFIIRKKTRGVENDDDASMDDSDKAMIEKLTDFVLSCGSDEDMWFADDFEGFTRKVIEDSLVLDQAVFEVPVTRVKEPISFMALDAATIRIADTYGQNKQVTSEKRDGYRPTHVQVYQGQIVAEWYPWELGVGIRNPQTSIYSSGYGRSEMEELVQVITALLNSDSYNAKFFQNGTAPKGALLVKKAGGLNNDVIQAFKREWGNEMRGVNNAHKTPIFDAEHIEWMDLHKSNKDMEYSKYQEYLIKLACAIYKISPEEIGFSIQGTNSSGLGGAGRGQAKQDRDYSIDKGLKPLLKGYESWLNKWILSPLTKGEYELKFVGLDAETSEQEEERLQKAVTTYMTVNEVRKQKGMEPLEGDEYNMILNPVIAQMKQMQSMQGMGGEPEGGDDWQDSGMGGGYDSPFADDEENPMMKSLLEDIDQLLVTQNE